jgi:hypothetical protein
LAAGGSFAAPPKIAASAIRGAKVGAKVIVIAAMVSINLRINPSLTN